MKNVQNKLKTLFRQTINCSLIFAAISIAAFSLAGCETVTNLVANRFSDKRQTSRAENVSDSNPQAGNPETVSGLNGHISPKCQNLLRGQPRNKIGSRSDLPADFRRTDSETGDTMDIWVSQATGYALRVRFQKPFRLHQTKRFQPPKRSFEHRNAAGRTIILATKKMETTKNSL